eukprot:Rmarinus@m.29564
MGSACSTRVNPVDSHTKEVDDENVIECDASDSSDEELVSNDRTQPAQVVQTDKDSTGISDGFSYTFGCACVAGYDPSCDEKRCQDDFICIVGGARVLTSGSHRDFTRKGYTRAVDPKPSYDPQGQCDVLPWGARVCRRGDKKDGNAYMYSSSNGAALFAVFDGHGPYGHKVATFCRRKLPKAILSSQYLTINPARAISSAVARVDAELAKQNIDVALSGTTAALVVLHRAELYTANIGDCRCVLGRRKAHLTLEEARGQAGGYEVMELTIDQTPDRPDEKARILELGGQIHPVQFMKEGNFIGPPRIWKGNTALPGLPMSRSLGDQLAKEIGVISDPEIQHTKLDDRDDILILATDGVWEFLPSDEAVDIVAQFSDPQVAAEWLVREACSRWEAEGDGICDDITATVVMLQ